MPSLAAPSLSDRLWPLPLEIIGGGLAGLSLGLALCRENIPVTLHDAGTYPRHRVCGEFICGLSESTVERLGLQPFLSDARLHRTLVWFVRGKPVRRQNLPRPAYGISRYALDLRLAEALEAAGGKLELHSRQSTDHTPPGRVFAVGRRAAETEWIGLKLHLFGLPLHSDLELHLGSEAYVGLSKIENDRVNLCGLFKKRPGVSGRREELLLAYLQAAGLGALAERLDDVDCDPHSFCGVAALDFQQPPPQPNRIFLGDAYALIPPFTGDGMAMAFESAELSLDPLLAYARGEEPWPRTVRRVSRRLQRHFRVRLASARSMHPFLTNPRRLRWLLRLNRYRLLPVRPLFHLLH